MMLVILVKKDKIYIISFIVVLLDQFIKYIVIKNMALLESISIIPNFFNIHYVQNTGAAWGIMKDKTIILTIISTFFLIIVNQMISKEKNFTKISISGYGLIVGGMLGNLIDRIIHSYVIDFLDFKICGYDFPIFNIADVTIVLGIILLTYEVIRSEVNEYCIRKRKC